MKTKEIREIILKELPDIIKHDKEIQDFILHLSKECFADKDTTEDRFDKILRELAEDRETQNRKWLEDSNRWWEQAEKWKEQDKRWQEQADLWDKQESKWEENQKVIREILESIKKMDQKYDSTIGALGARWGLRTEQSFRNDLKGILGEVSALEVINVFEYDDSGEVFGRPDQIEPDIIIKNGLLLICEIKSSMSKADIYIFHRKVEFYQKRHNKEGKPLTGYIANS